MQLLLINWPYVLLVMSECLGRIHVGSPPFLEDYSYHSEFDCKQRLLDMIQFFPSKENTIFCFPDTTSSVYHILLRCLTS